MNEKKLSEVMIEMAKQLLKKPQEIPSSEPFHVALLLATVAWNREVVGDDFQSNDQYYVKEEISRLIGCSKTGRHKKSIRH
jgi:hypothetical protein